MCLSVWARAHRFPTASSSHWPSLAVDKQELLWHALWVSLALKALLGQSLHPLTFQRTWWIEHAYHLFTMAWLKLLHFHHRCDAYTYSTGIIFKACNVEKWLLQSGLSEPVTCMETHLTTQACSRTCDRAYRDTIVKFLMSKDRHNCCRIRNSRTFWRQCLCPLLTRSAIVFTHQR